MKSPLVFGLLLWTAEAMPEPLQPRDCNRDNCFRDVFGTASPSAPAKGSSACSAYMTKVVTPCPVISTVIVSATVQASPVTSTSSVTLTSTSASTSIATSISTSTVTSTSPSTITTTIVVSQTTISTTTSPGGTVTSVQGGGVYTSQAFSDARNRKRTVDAETGSCRPSTSSASTVPTQYSNCAGGTRFSSVCRCNGFTTGVSTLLPATTTTTSTSTTTQTLTVQTTITVTTVLATTIQSSAQSIRLTTIITASFSTITATSTATITSTSTITSQSTIVLPPFPTVFIIRQNTNAPGGYMHLVNRYSEASGTVPNPAIENIPQSSAQIWTLRNGGTELWTADAQGQSWSPVDGGVLEVISPSDTADQQYYQIMSVSMSTSFDTANGGYQITFNNKQGSAQCLQYYPGGDLSFNYRCDLYPYVGPMFAVPP